MTTGSSGGAEATRPASGRARALRLRGAGRGWAAASSGPVVDESLTGHISEATDQLAGPLPISRVWSGTKVLAEDLAGEDLGDVLDLHDDALAWWVLDRSSDYAQDALQRLITEFGLDTLVVRELTAVDHRAKFEEIGQARLVLTNAVSLDRSTAKLTVHPLSILMTDRAIICLADVTPEIDPRRWLATAASRLAAGGTEAALQVMLAEVVDTYESAVSWLEGAADDLADDLFTGHSLSKERQLWAFRLRAGLTGLRRITEPMRTVMTDLREVQQMPRPKGHQKPAVLVRRWGLIAEHHQRVADAADSLRESLAAVFETSLALADVQLNTIMKKLTGWAAIIAVPTLLSGIVGMNVSFPLSGTVVGFWVYLLIMIAVALVLYVTFKRRDWI
ncbi:MAG TPA: CorA family divalent cation transporter [Microlunatus sp.]|nr:CorA family divalent cation transporter [Microlunatus sp.]